MSLNPFHASHSFFSASVKMFFFFHSSILSVDFALSHVMRYVVSDTLFHSLDVSVGGPFETEPAQPTRALQKLPKVEQDVDTYRPEPPPPTVEQISSTMGTVLHLFDGEH